MTDLKPLSRERRDHIKTVDRRFVSLDLQQEWLDSALHTIDLMEQENISLKLDLEDDNRVLELEAREKRLVEALSHYEWRPRSGSNERP